MSAPTLTEDRTLAQDLRAAISWHREVREDLVGRPNDPELLAQEELLAVLLDRLERKRLYGGD